MKTKSKPVNALAGMLLELPRILNPHNARYVADYRIDARSRKRIQMLGRKCNNGELTPDEHAEYEQIVRDLDLIAILQLEARAILRQTAK